MKPLPATIISMHGQCPQCTIGTSVSTPVPYEIPSDIRDAIAALDARPCDSLDYYAAS